MYGLDLVDFFRGRHTWRKLLTLLGRLPSSSAYVEALASDDEYAQAVLAARDDQGGRTGPSLSQWTVEADLLAGLADRIGEVIRVLLAVNGQKSGDIRPVPRPVTAFDRARTQARQLRHLSLVEEVKQAQIRYAQHGEEPDGADC